MAVARGFDPACDPELKSWVDSANQPGCDFPVQNLPFGVFRHPERKIANIGVAIGELALDLRTSADAGLLQPLSPEITAACQESTLNALMALGREHANALRGNLSRMLTSPAQRASVEPHLRQQRDIIMLLPAQIGDYTDFYASIFHATNVGKLFRPDNPLLPNYKWVPIGYHGRASSIVISGTEVRRPSGQLADPMTGTPRFAPTRLLDYELEIGAFVGRGNPQGEPVGIATASEHIFGLCLVNDWSARDVQAWEYQPLGPFLAKNFATTISPWVVTLEALEPFRVPAFRRPEGDPAPLPYLHAEHDQGRGGFDIQLEVLLLTERMRAANEPAATLSRGNFRDLYWTVAQLLTHHASNGCNLQPGDLFASGTVSGPEAGARGCLLEITERGVHPVQLPNGETRKFLEDGDEVILRGYCERPGAIRIGFGECRGLITPALDQPR